MSGTNSQSDVSNDSTDCRSVRYDPEANRKLSTAIALAVASYQDRAPKEVAPIANSINPDLIDTFVTEGEAADVDGELRFDFAGYKITVHASGLAELVPSEDVNA